MYNEINKTTEDYIKKQYIVIEKETLEGLLTHYDKKQDSRTDYIAKQLSWNNFWLFMIAIHYITKMLLIIFVLCFFNEYIPELINKLF